jgi:hypothetical protein
MNSVIEILWAIELNIMFKRWLDIRKIDPTWIDDLDMRRSWVRMNMRLGDGASHRITALRHAGATPCLKGGDDEADVGGQADQADADGRPKPDPGRQ